MTGYGFRKLYFGAFWRCITRRQTHATGFRVVRRLQSYYGEVRLPMPVHHPAMAPRLPDADRRREQLTARDGSAR
jgi:hypothetical protein